MKPEDFIAWREHLGISRAEACRLIGIHPNSVTNYEQGRTAIPLYIGLACAAVARKLKPWTKPPAFAAALPIERGA